MDNLKIGVLIYTYNRTDDAKINMEIIRNVWSLNDNLKDTKIIHAFNGEKDWWPEKYLEDDLIYQHNSGHFGGATSLIDEGMKLISEKYPDLDYVIVLASDTWLVLPAYLEKIFSAMKKEEKYVSACVWGSQIESDIFKKGAGLDFVVFDSHWLKKSNLFPIHFGEFKEKFQELFFYKDETIYAEIVFITRFIEAISRTVNIPSDNLLKKIADAHIYRMKEREPVHDDMRARWFFPKNESVRKMYYKSIGLITHHDPVPKQKSLRDWKLNLGQFGQNFLNARDLSYYNRGLERNSFSKNGNKINYGD